MGNRHRSRSRRVTPRWKTQSGSSGGQPVTLLSVNGILRDMHAAVTTTTPRATGYSPVAIGKPLLVRYLHFYLKHQDLENKNELMISTFLKSGEQKSAAAEAVNYYNKETRFSNGALTIRDFGGEKYGHPLVYYSKSYRGESLYLTTKIMELDSVSSGTKSAIENGLTAVGGLPMFAEYIPFLSVAKAGAGIVVRPVPDVPPVPSRVVCGRG